MLISDWSSDVCSSDLYDYCEGIVSSLEEALQAAGIERYELVVPEVTWTDRLIDFLVNPMISGVLLMLIIGGIYFEMHSPGIGFALIVSLTAAALYFMQLYVEGRARREERREGKEGGSR